MNINRLASLLHIKSIINYRSVTKKTIINADGKDVPKERINLSKITLINIDNSLTVTDLKSAQNISLRRDLKLVKVVDSDVKTKRPVYKLMSPSDYHKEELNNRKAKQEEKKNNAIKGVKLMTLTSRVDNHDLMATVKKIVKLIEKQYEVRIVITGQYEDTDNLEKVYSVIESHTKSISRILQKRIKGSNMKFQLLPLKEKATENPSGNESTTDDNTSKDDRGPL